MSTPAAVPDRLADRYGRRASPGARRAWWISVATVAIAATVYLAWVVLADAIDSVDYDTVGMEVIDDKNVRVDFQVVANPGTPFACAIEAQDTEYGIVGWRIIEYPGDSATTRQFSETIPTIAEATTGLAASCWIP